MSWRNHSDWVGLALGFSEKENGVETPKTPIIVQGKTFPWKSLGGIQGSDPLQPGPARVRRMLGGGQNLSFHFSRGCIAKSLEGSCNTVFRGNIDKKEGSRKRKTYSPPSPTPSAFRRDGKSERIITTFKEAENKSSNWVEDIWAEEIVHTEAVLL